MKSILTKTLISFFCLALIFGIGSSQYSSPASAHTNSLGSTKWVEVGWTKAGYKYNLYLSHNNTHKMVDNYNKVSEVLSAVSGLKGGNPLLKVITKPLSLAFKYEAPSIKKADKGKGIYIPITITWAVIPFVHGYYAQ